MDAIDFSGNPDGGNISIIITSSPVPSNPSMKMLRTVMDAFKLSPYLANCPIILVFDGFRIVDEIEAQYKSAQITTKQSEDYKAFQSAVLHHLSGSSLETPRKYSSIISFNLDLPNFQRFLLYFIIGSQYTYKVGPRLESTVTQTTLNSRIRTLSHSVRVGFALAVHSALGHVKTEYVLIQQHDWCFRIQVPFVNLLKTLDELPEMNYIGFISRQVLDYANRKTNRAPKVSSEVVIKNSEPMTRLCFWYDKPHIARTDYYRTQVFGHKRFRRGDFIEDTFGHIVLHDSKKEGMEGWGRYGCWLWYPDDALIPTIQHLNGRRFQEEPGYWARNDAGEVYYQIQFN